jgi:hypothetical protein
MVESSSPTHPSPSVLVFEQPLSRRGAILLFGIFFGAVGLLATSEAPQAAGGVVVGCLLITSMFAFAASRRWTAEIDLKARRFRLSRQSFGRWARYVVDCPFDQCVRLGRIEYDTEGSLSYGVYIELTNGRRHAIPLKESTLTEAGAVAARLAKATGIARLDTSF